MLPSGEPGLLPLSDVLAEIIQRGGEAELKHILQQIRNEFEIALQQVRDSDERRMGSWALNDGPRPVTEAFGKLGPTSNRLQMFSLRKGVRGEFVVMPRLASDTAHDNVSASDRI